MQIIYNCTFQTNHFSTVYIVAGILLLQFMAHVVLFPLLNVLYIIIIIIIIIIIEGLQEVGGSRGNWIELAQDRDRWWALVGRVTDFRVP